MSESLERKVDRLLDEMQALELLKVKVKNLKADLIEECLKRRRLRVRGSRGEAVVSYESKRVILYRLAIDEMVQIFNLPNREVERILEWNTTVAEGVPVVKVTPLDKGA